MSTLNSKEGDKELKTVRLQKVYPEVFMDQSEVFGCIGENGTWRDGIFTALIRKSIKVNHNEYMYVHMMLVFIGNSDYCLDML